MRRRAKTPPRRSDLEQGDRAGVWRVDRELGKGGMATVYAVTHAKFGKRAALKLAHRDILHSEFTAETFLREARIVNLIDHPSMPDVFATGSYDGRPYIAMERLVGQTLGDRVANGPVDRPQVIEILIELCDVLRAAHDAGVVHRDLKLDNIFVLHTTCADGRHVKLLDWGVASVLGEDDPMRGMIAGTLTYVAPEQVRGDTITTAADIYSLAVLAYQLLVGQPPFAARSDLELIDKHLREPPPAPETLWSDIPADLASLLVAMLAKQPEDRPQLDEIVSVLEQMRVALAPPSPRRRSWLAIPAVAPTGVPPVDVLGRAAVELANVLGRAAVVLPAVRHRLLGATMAIAIAVATVISLR